MRLDLLKLARQNQIPILLAPTTMLFIMFIKPTHRHAGQSPSQLCNQGKLCVMHTSRPNQAFHTAHHAMRVSAGMLLWRTDRAACTPHEITAGRSGRLRESTTTGI